MNTATRLALRLAVVSALLVATSSAQQARAQPAGARPWLGVALQVDSQGVQVGHVTRGSPAEAAGVRDGDRLLRVAGAVIRQASDVVRAVAANDVGDRIPIEFSRGQGTQKAEAVLAAFPSQDELVRMDLLGVPAPVWKDTQAVSGAFPSSVAAMRGRVVLLDFWATWCAPCRVSIPKLEALQSRYGAQGLSVVGISTEDAADVALFTKRMSMHYGVGVDPHGTTTRAYSVLSLPTLVVIDRAGKVRDVEIGYDPSVNLDATVKSLLSETYQAP